MEQSEEQLVCPSQYNTDGANFNIVFCSWADLKNAVLFSRVRSKEITNHSLKATLWIKLTFSCGL